jgi:hypothetical protein
MNDITINTRAANETLMGDLSSYFRWNEEAKQYQMNRKIDPRVETEDWVDVPSTVRDIFCDPNTTIPLGNLVCRLANAEMRNRQQSQRIEDIMRQGNDMTRIVGQRLLDEAENRGWCDEFDKIIEEVNGELSGMFQLPTRKRMFTVEVEVTGTHTTTYTVEVEAKNSDEAYELVDESPSDYFDPDEVMTDAVRYDSWDDIQTEIGSVGE